MAIKGESYNILNKNGVSLQHQGKYLEAIECYNKAILKYPKYVRAIVNRGLAKMSLKNYFDAIKDFDLSLKLNSEALHIKKYVERCKFEIKISDYLKDSKINNKGDEKLPNIEIQNDKKWF